MAASPGGRVEPVAWSVVENVAHQLLRFTTPLEPRLLAGLDDDFAEATARAEVLVERETGLHASGHAVAKVTDRQGWVDANVSSFRRLLEPLGDRLAERRSLLQLGPTSAMAAGVEVAVLLTWMSGRVLGQYDLLPPDADGPGDVVYYVGPNIVALERRHGFPPREFRLWIALHEVTHRLQFAGVPWMRPHFFSLVERGLELSLPDTKSVLDALRRAASEIRSGRNPLEEGGVVGLLAGSDQLDMLHEAQALMSLLEGHGDVVMSSAGADEIPGAKRFARVLAERRQRSRGLGRVMQQALGVEAKLRQYSQGEVFIEAVQAAGGDELFGRVWEGPEQLPSLEEIKHPERWVERIAGAAHAAR